MRQAVEGSTCFTPVADWCDGAIEGSACLASVAEWCVEAVGGSTCLASVLSSGLSVEPVAVLVLPRSICLLGGSPGDKRGGKQKVKCCGCGSKKPKKNESVVLSNNGVFGFVCVSSGSLCLSFYTGSINALSVRLVGK